MRQGRRVRVASHSPSSLISNRAISSSAGRPTVQVSLSTSMPVLLSEQDVRIVLSIRELIDTMETALVTIFSRRRGTASANGDRGGASARVRRRHARISSRARSARYQSRERIWQQCRRRPPDSPGDDRPARSDDRGAAVDHGRALHHRSDEPLPYRRSRRDTSLAPTRQDWRSSAPASRREVISRRSPWCEKLREVRVWSRSLDNRTAFTREMRPRVNAPVSVAASAQDAVDGADLIVLATASREPVVRSEWIADGAHVCAVGACRPDQREMDTDLVRRGRVFVDSRTGALAEAGDIVIPLKAGAFDETHVVGELGEVAAGKLAGRTSADRRDDLQIAGNGG